MHLVKVILVFIHVLLHLYSLRCVHFVVLCPVRLSPVIRGLLRILIIIGCEMVREVIISVIPFDGWVVIFFISIWAVVVSIVMTIVIIILSMMAKVFVTVMRVIIFIVSMESDVRVMFWCWIFISMTPRCMVSGHLSICVMSHCW